MERLSRASQETVPQTTREKSKSARAGVATFQVLTSMYPLTPGGGSPPTARHDTL